jgi:hypothetical protein
VATLPAGNVNAIALSDGWIVYRVQGPGGRDSLLAARLGAGGPQPLAVLSAPAGEIGRPALDGSALVYSLNSRRGSRIERRNLLTGARRVLRSSSSYVAFANPSLLHGRLLYERFDRCRQELRVGAMRTSRHDRVLLRLASTALRDRGYQPGYEHAYNGASLCANRAARARERLGSTALGEGVAYVTEISTDRSDARIVTISR